MTRATASFLEPRSRWLQRLSGTDRLTGMPNREWFEDELEETCAATDARGAAVSVVVVHVSGAEVVRSRFGASEADALIQRAARTVSRSIRASDFAARVAEDEFAIIFPDTELEQALRIARRIAHDAERANLQLLPNDVPMFLAFGAAAGNGFAARDLLHAADPGKANEPVVRAPAPIAGPTEDDGPSVA